METIGTLFLGAPSKSPARPKGWDSEGRLNPVSHYLGF